MCTGPRYPNSDYKSENYSPRLFQRSWVDFAIVSWEHVGLLVKCPDTFPPSWPIPRGFRKIGFSVLYVVTAYLQIEIQSQF